MKGAHPYLNFKGNTREAFEFYRSVFGGDFQAVIRFRDFGPNGMGVAEKDLDKIAHIALPLGPHVLLMATDVVDSMPMPLTAGNNFSISLEPESAEEADRLFTSLSTGGGGRHAAAGDRVGRKVRLLHRPVRHPVDGELRRQCSVRSVR